MNQIFKEIKNEFKTSNMEELEMLEMAEYYDSLDAEDFQDMSNAEYAEYAEFLEDLDNAEDAEYAEDAERKKHRRIGHGHPHKKRAHHTHGHPHKKHTAVLMGGAGLVAGSAGGYALGRGRGLKGSPHTNKALSKIGGGHGWARPNSFKKSPPAYGSADYIHALMTTTKGDLNITVIRQTANIAAPLPYILFGLNGFSSSFISTLKQYLPTIAGVGTSLVASSDPNNGDMLLTFTNGGNVDIVRTTLTGSQISYSEFLQNMNQNFFKTRFIKQSYVNDANLLLSTSQQIQFGLLSALGSKSANNLLPRSRSLTTDYQPYNINLLLDEQRVTADFSFVQNIVAVANTTIGWDVFMSERVNLNNV